MLNFNPEFSQRTHGQIICISIIIYIFIKYEINKYNLMNQFMQPYLKLHVNTKKWRLLYKMYFHLSEKVSTNDFYYSM